MNLVVLPAAIDVASEGAKRIVEIAQAAIAQRGSFHLALSGGSTPRAIFDQFATGGFPAELVGATQVFWGDERSVSNDHDDSNVRMARESFLEKLQFPPTNIHTPNGGASDLAAEARRYEAEILNTVPCNRAGEPVFDVIMLGLGTDGHTASLFPGTAALAETERVVVENEVPQLDTWRLTLTYDAINAARAILIFVTGASKKPVLDAIRAGGAGYPIEDIRGDNSNVTWFADLAAAGKEPA